MAPRGGRFKRVPEFEQADLWLLACVLLWSLNISVVKVLLRYFAPLTISTMRVSLAFLLFAAVIAVRERSISIRRSDIPLVMGAAFSGIFLNQVFFALALHQSKASTVALLLGVIPVFVALITAALGIESVTRNLAAGVVLSAIGVVLIIETQPGVAHSVGTVEGALLALGASVSWAAYTLMVQPLLRRYSIARVSFWAAGLGLFGLLPIAFLERQKTVPSGIPSWTGILVLISGLGAIGLTNFLWYGGTYRLGPSRGSLYAFLQPFAGALLAVAILGDRIGVAELFGGVLVIIGIIIGRSAAKSKAMAVSTANPAKIEEV